jgi:glycosyltransferase involved in cell wall biosynthesis
MQQIKTKHPQASVFFYADPFQPIRNQGISRLLVHQLSGLAVAQGHIEILTAKWNIKTIRDIARDQNVKMEGIKFNSPPISLGLLAIFFFERFQYRANQGTVERKRNLLLLTNFFERAIFSISVVALIYEDLFVYGICGLILSILLHFRKRILSGILRRFHDQFRKRYFQIVTTHKDKLLAIEKKMRCVWLVPSPHQTLIRSFKNPVVLIIPDIVGIEYPFLFGANEEGTSHFEETLIDLRSTIKAAELIICYSNSVKNKQIIPLCPLRAEDILVIPNAKTMTDHQTMKPKKERFGLRKTGYFFYPTQLRSYKNLETLIEALYIYNKFQSQKSRPTAKLLFTGTGDCSSELRGLIKDYGLTEKIEFTGNINGVELKDFYRESIAAISPSWHEGGFSFFPISEAWSENTPCIFSLTEANVEFLGLEERRYTFRPGFAFDLAQKMLVVASDREAMLRHQQDELSRIFNRTWEDVANEYLDAAKQLFESV